jgi:hypothetical protein
VSLNRTLTRVFSEIRREAKTNARFAQRIEAILDAHVSRRAPGAEDGDEPPEELAALPQINPVGLIQREGEDGLKAALNGAWNEAALRALISEHNLDPGGQAGGLDRDALVGHIVAQARRRAERDSKLFDY